VIGVSHDNRLEDAAEHRRLLFSIAYRMLGSAADADDMVQETFLRYARAPATEVDSPRAYLVTVVTRLCIDHQRSAWTRHRDTSLPEPVPTAALLDPLDPAERAQSLSIAFLLLLRTLTPVERAVFLLRDVLDVDYAEIAAIVGRSEDNCRQITRRARQHVAAARPRFEATRAEAAALAERFSALCRAGDRTGLTTLLAEDVTFIVDAGAAGLTYGKARAIDRPMHGAEAVARFLVGVQRQAPVSMDHRVADVNGQPGLLVYQDDALHALLSLDVRDGRVRQIYLIGDPEKLGRLRAAER
jgi:RNA polymerase sigma-70 factor (ECF subfamily)